MRSMPVQALPRNGDLVLARKPQAQVRPQPKVVSCLYRVCCKTLCNLAT